MTERRQTYQRQLDAIEANVIELFALVAEDLPKATSAVVGEGAEALDVLAERERAIDILYLQVEELVVRELTLQAPAASDLRFLLSVLRIAPELERSHDLVMQIGTRASRIPGAALSPAVRQLVQRMGDLTAQMWRAAADSWYQRDRAVADGLARRDREMDTLQASLTEELKSAGLPLPLTMEMTLVGWFYGRLADHAVNIARRVVFLAGSLPPP